MTGDLAHHWKVVAATAIVVAGLGARHAFFSELGSRLLLRTPHVLEISIYPNDALKFAAFLLLLACSATVLLTHVKVAVGALAAAASWVWLIGPLIIRGRLGSTNSKAAFVLLAPLAGLWLLIVTTRFIQYNATRRRLHAIRSVSGTDVLTK